MIFIGSLTVRLQAPGIGQLKSDSLELNSKIK